MSILVTGATGFIGSHLCRELVKEGSKVVALTRSGRTDNVAQLLTYDNFHLCTGDIRDTTMLQDLVKDNNVQTVFHLAAMLNDNTIDNSSLYYATNILGTRNLLTAACSEGVDIFIYASTMSVYSEPPDYLPVDEDHPTQPDTTYGATKLEGELCCHLFDDRTTMIVLRYSGVYGSNSHKSDAVPTFMRQALSNQPITIFGDGTQSSDFLHIDDVIQGTLLAREKGEPGVYNIGSGQETSVRELAELIINVTGSKSKPVTGSGKVERPFRFVMDISRARKVLGYSPRTLEDRLNQYTGEIGHDI